MERRDLKTEIENLKKVNDERVKGLQKFNNENRGIRELVNGCKIVFGEDEWCMEKCYLKNKVDNLKKVNNEGVKKIDKLMS